MIDLTRLNGHPIVVNCDLIKFVESTPDTTLALVTGEKLIVLESPGEVVERTAAFRGSILSLAWPDAASALTARSASRSACNPAFVTAE